VRVSEQNAEVEVPDRVLEQKREGDLVLGGGDFLVGLSLALDEVLFAGIFLGERDYGRHLDESAIAGLEDYFVVERALDLALEGLEELGSLREPVRHHEPEISNAVGRITCFRGASSC